MSRVWSVLWLMCVLLCGLASSILANAYSTHELQGYGLQYDRWHSEACDLNNNGWTVGCISTDANSAIGTGLWKSYQDDLVDLQSSYGIIWPGGVNDSGAIAAAFDYNGSTTAAVWSPAGVTKLMTQPMGMIESWATDINNAGQVIGSGTVLNSGTLATWAMLWNTDGTATTIHSSTAGVCTTSGINGSGTVVGFSLEYEGSEEHCRAFRWSAATGYDQLALLPGTYASYAYGINDAGQIVGACDNRAVMWESDGSVIDLGGAGSACAYGINSDGYVVGSYNGMGVVWTPEKTIVTLDTSCRTPSSATAINDMGQIVGYMTLDGGVMRAVLWQPVPEPTSLLALAAGIAGLVIRRRR